MSDDTRQIQEVKAKRTAKNSVFLDLFQDKKNLLVLYKTLHPEDTDATEAEKTDTISLSQEFFNGADKRTWNDETGSYGNNSYLQG